MTSVAADRALLTPGCELRSSEDPQRHRPAREGLRRPGTAVGNPQVPF